MTDLPYTEEDLRAEAGLARDALMHLPTVEEVAASLNGSYIPHLHADGDDATWGNLLDQKGLVEAARQICELMIPAAPVGGWAVSLGADGLEPEDHTLSVDGDGKPLVRLHCAFHPDLDDAARAAFVAGLGQALADGI